MIIEINTTHRRISIIRGTHTNNDAEFERKHPRAKDGKFSGSAPIKITTKPIADIKLERKKTEQWYRDNLQGTSITHPQLGEIKFSRRGGKHSIQNTGPDKLALIKYLPDLIQTGTTKGWQPLSHPTPDAAVAIAPIENTAVINGETRRVGCFIRKYSDGSIYYDLFINKTAVDLTENITRANNGFDINSINQYDEEVNLFIYGD